MSTRNVQLTEHFDRLIDAGIESGQFRDASEVVREGLRLLEQRQREDRAKIEWLRGAVQVGIDDIDRGEGVEFASIEELADHICSLGDEALSERAAGSKHG